MEFLLVVAVVGACGLPSDALATPVLSECTGSAGDGCCDSQVAISIVSEITTGDCPDLAIPLHLPPPSGGSLR